MKAKQQHTHTAIMRAVSEVTGLTVTEIKGKRRFVRFVSARQIFGYISIEEGHTLYRTGKYLNRDHSTIHHGNKALVAHLAIEPAARYALSVTRKILKGIREPRFKGRPVQASVPVDMIAGLVLAFTSELLSNLSHDLTQMIP